MCVFSPALNARSFVVAGAPDKAIFRCLAWEPQKLQVERTGLRNASRWCPRHAGLLSCSMMGSCGEREGQFCRPRCPRQDQLPSFARDWSSSVMCGTSLCEVCAAMGMTRGRPSGGKRLAPCSRFGKRFWVLCGRGGCAFGSLLLWGEREERYANDDEYSRSDQLPLRDYLVECLNSHERGVSYVRPRCVQD